jgi:hypothetical protein
MPPMREVHEPYGSRRKWAKRIAIAVGVVAVVALVGGAGVIFAWMVDETHFDRASADFDALTAEVDQMPGIDLTDAERWVEAPTFATPTSWIGLAVDRHALPGLLDAACATDYPDSIDWSMRIRTDSGGDISVSADTSAPGGGHERCAQFGFDVVSLVDEIDRIAPGTAVHASVWDDGRFALGSMDEYTKGFAHLLPLVASADRLLDAAGLAPDRTLSVNAGTLDLTVARGESERYVALLSKLGEEHDASAFWADGAGTPTDGVEKVQIIAPEKEHEAIERLVQESELRVADMPVRFIER